MARYAGRHESSGDPIRDAAMDAEALRDRLTREWLAVAIAGRDADVVAYDPRWWDGGAYERCLVITSGTDRMRVVESNGEAIVLPFDRKAAVAQLDHSRAPHRPELSLPQPRSETLICIDASDDVVRCSAEGCGALVAIESESACRRCGRSLDEPVDAQVSPVPDH